MILCRVGTLVHRCRSTLHAQFSHAERTPVRVQEHQGKTSFLVTERRWNWGEECHPPPTFFKKIVPGSIWLHGLNWWLKMITIFCCVWGGSSSLLCPSFCPSKNGFVRSDFPHAFRGPKKKHVATNESTHSPIQSNHSPVYSIKKKKTTQPWPQPQQFNQKKSLRPTRSKKRNTQFSGFTLARSHRPCDGETLPRNKLW